MTIKSIGYVINSAVIYLYLERRSIEFDRQSYISSAITEIVNYCYVNTKSAKSINQYIPE